MRLPPPRPSAPACAAALLAAVLSTTPLLPERAALAEPGTTQLLSSLFSCQKAIIKGKEELVCTQAIDDAGELVKDPLPNPLEKYLPPRSTPLPPPYAPPSPAPPPAPAPVAAQAPAPAQVPAAEMSIAEKREEQRAAAEEAGKRAARLAAERAEQAQAAQAQRSEEERAKEAVRAAAKEAERELAKTKAAELEAEAKARKRAKEEALAKARESSGAGREEKKAREREAQRAAEEQKKAAEAVPVKEPQVELPARDAPAEREAGARQAAEEAAQPEPAAKPQAAPEQTAPATGGAGNGVSVMGVEVKVSPLFTPGEVKLPPLPSLGGGGMKLSLPRASVHKSGRAHSAANAAALPTHRFSCAGSGPPRGLPRAPRREASARGCRGEIEERERLLGLPSGGCPELPTPIPPPLWPCAGRRHSCLCPRSPVPERAPSHSRRHNRRPTTKA